MYADGMSGRRQHKNLPLDLHLIQNGQMVPADVDPQLFHSVHKKR